MRVLVPIAISLVPADAHSILLGGACVQPGDR
jgi:hypothetical protein